MYESLIEWLKFPCLLHTFISKDIAGDATYAEPKIIESYRVDTLVELKDENNKTYLSQQQVYLRENEHITLNDMLSFPEAPDKKYAIRKISAYFDGNLADKSIIIAYL